MKVVGVMRGSSRKEEEGKGCVANEFINACEEEGAKHVPDDTVQVRSERKEGRTKERHVSKRGNRKNQKLGQISFPPPHPQNFKRVVFSFSCTIMYTSQILVSGRWMRHISSPSKLSRSSSKFLFFIFILPFFSSLSVSLSGGWLYCR